VLMFVCSLCMKAHFNETKKRTTYLKACSLFKRREVKKSHSAGHVLVSRVKPRITASQGRESLQIGKKKAHKDSNMYRQVNLLNTKKVIFWPA